MFSKRYMVLKWIGRHMPIPQSVLELFDAFIGLGRNKSEVLSLTLILEEVV